MPRKVYSYIRFSTPQQLKGDSLRRQLEASEAWAKERGYQIDTSLRDLGLSAYHGDHAAKGQLGAFLGLVREGRVAKGSILVVEHLDRLSREAVTDALPQFMDLIRAGITVVTLQDRKEFSKASVDANPMDLMFSIMLMSQANTESKKRSERIKEKWSQWRTNGGLAGNHPGWISKGAKGLMLNKQWVPIVRRIVRMCLHGDGINRIARTLNQEGIASFKGGSWHPVAINRLLHNHALYGARQFRDEGKLEEKIHSGYYHAVIDEPTFFRIQALLKLRRGDKGRHSEVHLNIFAGLTYCGTCGKRMRIQRECGRKADTHYLVCDSWKRGTGCTQSNRTSAGWLEEQINHFVSEVGDTIVRRTRAIERDETQELDAKIERREEELERLVTAIEKGGRPVAILKRIDAAEQDIAQLRAELTEARERQRAPQRVAENIGLLKGCVDRVKLRDVMREVFQRIEVEKRADKTRSIRIYFRDDRNGTLLYDKNGSLWVYMYKDAGGELKFAVEPVSDDDSEVSTT